MLLNTYFVFRRSGFFIFCSEHRPKIKAQYPHMGIGEVAKKLGEMWNNLTEAHKQPYVMKANKLKDKYQQVMSNIHTPMQCAMH